MFGGEVGVFGGEASPLPPPLDRTLILYNANARARKLATPCLLYIAVLKRVVLPVLAPTRAGLAYQ